MTFKQIPPLKVTESEKSSATKSEHLEESAEILSNSSSMSKPEKSPLPKEGSKSPLPKEGSKEKSPSQDVLDAANTAQVEKAVKGKFFSKVKLSLVILATFEFSRQN